MEEEMKESKCVCFVHDFNVSMIIEAVFNLLDHKIVDGLFKQQNPLLWKRYCNYRGMFGISEFGNQFVKEKLISENKPIPFTSH